MAAFMGTAIHTAIESAFAGNPRYLLEEEVSFEGLMGHIDLIDIELHEVWDWKTTSKANLSYFPSRQQITQVQLYGYLANACGIEVKRVGLVAIARDGNEDDIVEWSADYDPALAQEALSRLQGITEMEVAPAPEKDANFCAKYCEFYGACDGRNPAKDGELIIDPAADNYAQDYIVAQHAVKVAEARMEAAKAELVGVSGTTLSGIRVSWSEVSGRQSIDEAEVQKALGFVPKKQGRGYSRLTVKS
jgi:hypothetical protein